MAIADDDDDGSPVVTFSQSLSPALAINEQKFARGSVAESSRVLQQDGAAGYSCTATSQQYSTMPALHHRSSSHLFPARSLQTDSASCPLPAVSTRHNNLPHRSELYPDGISPFPMTASVRTASHLRRSGVKSENMGQNATAAVASLATAGSTVRHTSNADSNAGTAIFAAAVPPMAAPSSLTARNVSLLPANVQRRNNNISPLTEPNNNVTVHTQGLRFGVDAFMDQREVTEVLEMGFDVEAVRNVVHLRVVETGENYKTTVELIDAVLAYNVAAIDLFDTGSSQAQQQQQQQQRQPPSRETTNSRRSSPDGLETRASSRTETVNAVGVSPSNQTRNANTSARNRTYDILNPPARSHTGDVADSVSAASSVSIAAPSVNNAPNATVTVPGAGVTSNAAAAAAAASGSSAGKKSAKKKSKRKNKRTVNSNVAGSAADSAVVSTLVRPTTTTTQSSHSHSQPPTTQSDGEAQVVPWLIEQENKRLKSSKICKICMEAEVKIVFVPCGHIVCCDGCSSLTSKCPACQTRVKQAVKVFFS